MKAFQNSKPHDSQAILMTIMDRAIFGTAEMIETGRRVSPVTGYPASLNERELSVLREVLQKLSAARKTLAEGTERDDIPLEEVFTSPGVVTVLQKHNMKGVLDLWQCDAYDFRSLVEFCFLLGGENRKEQLQIFFFANEHV